MVPGQFQYKWRISKVNLARHQINNEMFLNCTNTDNKSQFVLKTCRNEMTVIVRKAINLR